MKFADIQRGDLLQFGQWRQNEMKVRYGLVLSDKIGTGSKKDPFYFHVVMTDKKGGIVILEGGVVERLRRYDMHKGIKKVKIPALEKKILLLYGAEQI